MIEVVVKHRKALRQVLVDYGFAFTLPVEALARDLADTGTVHLPYADDMLVLVSARLHHERRLTAERVRRQVERRLRYGRERRSPPPPSAVS
jgi:hypothetical protein